MWRSGRTFCSRGSWTSLIVPGVGGSVHGLPLRPTRLADGLGLGKLPYFRETTPFLKNSPHGAVMTRSVGFPVSGHIRTGFRPFLLHRCDEGHYRRVSSEVKKAAGAAGAGPWISSKRRKASVDASCGGSGIAWNFRGGDLVRRCNDYCTLSPNTRTRRAAERCPGRRNSDGFRSASPGRARLGRSQSEGLLRHRNRRPLVLRSYPFTHTGRLSCRWRNRFRIEISGGRARFLHFPAASRLPGGPSSRARIR